MRVYEVAREFKIDPEKLTQLLRSMGVAVRSEATTVDDATVAKLRARFERERRAGHGEAEEAISTVIEDTQQTTKRRRRKKEDLPPAPEPEAVEEIAAAAPVIEPEPIEPTILERPERTEKKSPFLEDLPPLPKEEPIAAEAAPVIDTEAPAAPPAPPAAPAKREITAEQKPKLRRAAEVLGWTTPRNQQPQQRSG